MNVLFHRQSEVGLQETEGGFRTQMFTASDPTDIDYAGLRADLNREVERFTNIGSGWTLTAILRFVLRIGEYRPFVGSSFVPTPASLVAKQALVNVYNPDDNMCFAWAVLSALYPCQRNAMYSLLTYDQSMTKRTAKGIKKRYVSKHVRHDMYLRTLRERTIERAKYRLFRSRAHKIETVECTKIALCAYDDKRYVLIDGVSTYAYGHVLL